MSKCITILQGRNTLVKEDCEMQSFFDTEI